jgi:diguanylate cyclase (GGDEF)-like protein/PAS domain S-box-containing protein
MNNGQAQIEQLSEPNLRFIFDNSPFAVRIASKANNKVLYANANFSELIGQLHEQSIGVDVRQFYENQREFDYILEQLGNGNSVSNKLVKLSSGIEVKWALTSFIAMEFEGESAYLALIYDITDRKKLEEQVEYLSLHDILTGLPNRRMLNDRLHQAMALNVREGTYGAVMFMDLDKFKLINDQHGHAAGDLLLIEVSRRIRSCLREIDSLIRFGGDEFIVMLGQIATDESISQTVAANVAEKIQRCLSETYFLKLQKEGSKEIFIEHNCTSSIGVTLFTGREESQDEIIRQADVAMYQAKKSRGGKVFHFIKK